MSSVSADYAPSGRHLIAVSGVDGSDGSAEHFHEGARTQMRRWFGPGVDQWDHLRSYSIPHALPRHPAGFARHRPGNRTSKGVWLTGDYTDFGSIQGALRSGRTTADAILERATEATP